MKRLALNTVLAIAGTALLASCGGGGGGSSSNNSTSSPSTTSLSGTASVGAPMAGASITAIDVTGNTLKTTADSGGAYSFSDISTLKAPILISATGYVGNNPTTYSSILSAITVNANNIANTTPITDAIVFQAAGQSPGNLITTPSLMAGITTATVNASVSNVAAALANVLNGITPGSASGYSPISSSFTADGSHAYDKINDLLVFYPSSSVGASSIAINIADKSGGVGTVTIPAGVSSGSVAPLPAIPSAVASLALSSLQKGFATFNQLTSTTAGLNSDTFASMFSDSYLDNGMDKPTFLSRARNPSSDMYFLGWKISNPVVKSCTTAGVCAVTFLVTDARGNTGKTDDYFIYDLGTGKWLSYGNHQDDVEVGFQSYAQLSNSSGKFNVGIDFGIHDSLKKYPYNSAKAVFQDKNGDVDTTVYFLQKPSTCPTSSPTYWGLPFANTNNPTSQTPDAACNGWYSFSDETLLKKMNTKILQGGYKIIVSAYTSTNWTGTAKTKTLDITTPFLTSDKINNSMFPVVKTATGQSGPYLSIPNGSDYSLIGSVCLSSNTSVGYCDMTNRPAATTVYEFNFEPPLATTYLAKTSDGWSASQTIKSYFVHAQDKYGRDLRVNN